MMLSLTKSEKSVLLFLSLTLVVGLIIRQYQTFQFKNNYSKSTPINIVVKMDQTEKMIEQVKSTSKLSINDKKQYVININNANAQVLTTLKGVGPALAKRIVEYRNTHGAFTNKKDIMLVKGIGEKLYKNNKTTISIHD